MDTVEDVMATLEAAGDPRRIKAFANHGAPTDRLFGVSVADMKKIAKTIRGRQELALELFDTGHGDAQYLAGMVARGKLMSKRELDRWARDASWQMVSEYTVPWVASESDHGQDRANKWIRAKKPYVATSGWATYAGHVTVTEDAALDLDEVIGLLDEIESGIESAPNRVRYTMNGFVIAVGCYVTPLAERAKEVASNIGRVHVEMGGTSCKVPFAPEVIAKVEKMGRAGKKRKAIRC